MIFISNEKSYTKAMQFGMNDVLFRIPQNLYSRTRYSEKPILMAH